jgi:diguanylate cyclase (GGDEF)-like protein/PAS domain S-box-containing protein
MVRPLPWRTEKFSLRIHCKGAPKLNVSEWQVQEIGPVPNTLANHGRSRPWERHDVGSEHAGVQVSSSRQDTWWEEALLTAAPVMLFAVDREWRILFANGEFERRFPISGTTDIGRTLWELLPRISGTLIERNYREAMATNEEREFMAKGFTGWYRTHIRPFPEGLLVSLSDITEQKSAEERASHLAAEHAMLHRVAEAVVRGTDPAELFETIARELGQLLGVRAASVGRDLGGTHTEVLGNWTDDDELELRLGIRVSDPEHEFRRAIRSGMPVRSTAADGTISRVFGAAGCQAAFAVPIYAGGRLWGGLITASMDPDAYTGEDARRQIELSELAGQAIGNIEAQEQLVRLATSDPLTGLINHRTFQERMKEAVQRAQTGGVELALALLDIDDFRVVNEMRGHRTGDSLLAAAAGALRAFARPGDVLARVGGDEFALLLEGVDVVTALPTIERARAAVTAGLRRAGGSMVTTSVGLCDLSSAGSAERLFELADGALYWSKAHGRNRACVFDPAVVRELSAADRAKHLERTRALVGISALARAIDAKDPATRRHSDRVAALATRLAEVAGWAPAPMARLQEAALIHDVGKIGVPDAILLKPGALGREEYEQMKRHALLGAEMLQGVLTMEQVTWVRGHHERPDGSGYPDALTAEHIDDGAALLAQADAFEAIVTRRVYSPARTVAEAVDECASLAGRQFMPMAVEALKALFASGALDAWARPEQLSRPMASAPGGPASAA